MPSSKGIPTDPELQIKQETNKDGGGKGQWAAWKASKLAKEYEKQGGGYENEPGSKNEPKEGKPEHKSESKKKKETDG
ncbi:hypothetical protein VMCG_05985 [Cytospora schulzeri]|uniref:Uncharacterized protein n=1 Tax=Cytospora schulzeri TaxID=448051 RepID=A0A423WDB4_9PEZI|nr:hypothetical protein VMCG_05985 [Valsa malicola]